jgi:hypothetical protein
MKLNVSAVLFTLQAVVLYKHCTAQNPINNNKNGNQTLMHNNCIKTCKKYEKINENNKKIKKYR